MSGTRTAARTGRPRADGGGSGDARAQILDAAAALFVERGYAATSTRAIAERVGIRQASLYYHFAGKDDLLLELLETSVRPSLDVVERLAGGSDPRAALWTLAHTDVETLLATPHNIGSLYWAPEAAGAAFEPFRQQRSQLQRAYERGAAAVAGEADAVLLGACCMQLVEMVIPMRHDGPPPPDLPVRIADACLRVVDVRR